jgi:hypothetical protein
VPTSSGPDPRVVEIFRRLDGDGRPKPTAVGRPGSIAFVIDGGGSAITTGGKGYLQVDFPCVVSSWTLLGDVSGSIVITIKKSTYASFPTTTSIVASDKPTLSSAQKATGSSLTGWTTKIDRGDVLEYSVDSAATVTRVTVSLKVRRLERTQPE